MNVSRERLKRLSLIFFCLLLLDTVTKSFTHYHIPLMDWSVPSYPYGGIAVFKQMLGIDLSINHVVNRGGPWGVISSHHNFLLGLRMIAIFCIGIHLLYFNTISFRQIPLTMIISGAVGNVIDSFFYGHVVDMIHFVFWGYSFPVFNVADSCIFLGVISMMIHACVKKIKEKRAAASSNGSGPRSDFHFPMSQ